jgi:hypothetical protein
MKNVGVYLFCILICLSGCKIIKLPYTIAKSVGEDIGEAIGLKKENETKSEPVVDENGKVIKLPVSNNPPITAETVGNLLWYCVVTLAVLLAVRYGMKKFKRKDE